MLSLTYPRSLDWHPEIPRKIYIRPSITYRYEKKYITYFSLSLTLSGHDQLPYKAIPYAITILVPRICHWTCTITSLLPSRPHLFPYSLDFNRDIFYLFYLRSWVFPVSTGLPKTVNSLYLIYQLWYTVKRILPSDIWFHYTICEGASVEIKSYGRW